MPDNIDVTPSNKSRKVSVATDLVGGTHYPIYKQAFGLPDVAPTHVSSNYPLPVSDFYLEVAKGNVAGHSITSVSARNIAVGTVYEDIWGGGALSSLAYDAQSGAFTAGLTVTGTTSNATGVIVIDDDDGATGTLTLRSDTGTFQNDEAITDTSTGAATINGTLSSLGIMTIPTVGETWEIVAESANDASAGTGARTVRVTYLDADHVEQTETVSLSGVTPVVMTATDAFRFISVEVRTWGSATNALYGKCNLGNIVVRDTTSKNIRGVIEFDDTVALDFHGKNISRTSFYTVPAGKTAFITSSFINTSKNHEADILLLLRLPGDDGFTARAQQSVYQNSVEFDFTPRLGRFIEKIDIKFIARTNNAAVDVNIAYALVVVDN